MIDITPLLKIVAARRRAQLARMDASAVQERTLLKLVRHAADTRFGKDHSFAAIKSVADFQARVKLRNWEAMWDDYYKAALPNFANVSWPGATPYLALSSGTTSARTKYVPVTEAMNRSNSRAGFDLVTYHFEAKPRSRLFDGKTFMLGGSTKLVPEAPGVWSGDLSGIAVKRMPFWARSYAFPKEEHALMSNWEEKAELMARTSLDEKIRALTGTPAWILMLLDRVRALREARGESRSPAYPGLELLVHGGVNFAPYRARFEKLFAGLDVDMREVYPASEGFIAIADRGYGEGLRLNLDHGLFFEFVPLEDLSSANPRRHWIANVETGVNYAVVMSTCAGLWAYVIGDTVRFVDKSPPRILITGRTTYWLSAFGEHLLAEQIETGVAAASAAIGADVTDYSVSAVFPEAGKERCGHLYVTEFAGGAPDSARLALFATTLDTTLRHIVNDYDYYRKDGRIVLPEIRPVPPGTFAAWMKSRGKLGGQNKVPRIINDPELWGNLIGFVSAPARDRL
jgi:hypothetical protein